ncbi:hypothetical protein ACTVMJ_04320 [Serratia marcescens]
MDNKLSELSKPVAYDYQIAGACIADGHNENGKWVDWNNKLSRYCPPDWMMEEGKVTGLKPLYSQEYVSALLADNEYMRWRIKEIDLLFGQMLLTMQAAVIEIEHGEGPNAAMAWIVNKLAGPGEFAPDSEKDAQAYFNRESEKIDVEYSKCMDFFESRRKAMKGQSNG